MIAGKKRYGLLIYPSPGGMLGNISSDEDRSTEQRKHLSAKSFHHLPLSPSLKWIFSIIWRLLESSKYTRVILSRQLIEGYVFHVYVLSFLCALYADAAPIPWGWSRGALRQRKGNFHYMYGQD